MGRSLPCDARTPRRPPQGSESCPGRSGWGRRAGRSPSRRPAANSGCTGTPETPRSPGEAAEGPLPAASVQFLSRHPRPGFAGAPDTSSPGRFKDHRAPCPVQMTPRDHCTGHPRPQHPQSVQTQNADGSVPSHSPVRPTKAPTTPAPWGTGDAIRSKTRPAFLAGCSAHPAGRRPQLQGGAHTGGWPARLALLLCLCLASPDPSKPGLVVPRMHGQLGPTGSGAEPSPGEAGTRLWLRLQSEGTAVPARESTPPRACGLWHLSQGQWPRAPGAAQGSGLGLPLQRPPGPASLSQRWPLGLHGPRAPRRSPEAWAEVRAGLTVAPSPSRGPGRSRRARSWPPR